MPKEMSAAEYTKKVYEESPYKDKARDSDMRNKLNAMTNTAGAGRGGQGGPTAAQARQNRGMMSDAERAARDEAKERKEQEAADKAYEASRTSLKKGGSASARADGIAQRGKTRGTIVACGGGYMKGKK